jgi:hypothetical protein
MSFLQRNRQFNRLLALGMMLLAVAGIARLFLEHHTLFFPGLADGITGLLYGLGFACILLGFRRNRRCPATNSSSQT